MAASRRTPDPSRIAAAQISGIASRCAVAGRLTEDAALVEIGSALCGLPDARWREVLSSAAVHYVDADTDGQRAALALLVRAGADVERARAIRDATPGSFLRRD